MKKRFKPKRPIRKELDEYTLLFRKALGFVNSNPPTNPQLEKQFARERYFARLAYIKPPQRHTKKSNRAELEFIKELNKGVEIKSPYTGSIINYPSA